MKEDEVELIYEHLHANYEYQDGDLIKKKASHGKNKGHKLGVFMHGLRKNDCIVCALSINNKKYQSTLAHWIYVFHYKKKPSYIEYKDGNKMNTRIENLIESDAQNCNKRKFINSQGYTTKIKNNRILHEVKVTLDYKTLYFGSYEDSDQALQIYSFAKKFITEGIKDYEILKSKLKEKFDFFYIKEISNQTGFKGVIRARSKFMGAFKRNGKTILTKSFNTPEEAHKAYLEAKNGYENESR